MINIEIDRRLKINRKTVRKASLGIVKKIKLIVLIVCNDWFVIFPYINCNNHDIKLCMALE